MDKDKFEIEKEILFTIYSKKIVENYTAKGETTDFIITDSKNNRKIGVEITRLFNSQASAAFKNKKISNKFINEHKPEKKKKKPFLRNAHVAKLVSNIVGRDTYSRLLPKILQIFPLVSFCLLNYLL